LNNDKPLIFKIRFNLSLYSVKFSLTSFFRDDIIFDNKQNYTNNNQ